MCIAAPSTSTCWCGSGCSACSFAGACEGGATHPEMPVSADLSSGKSAHQQELLHCCVFSMCVSWCDSLYEVVKVYAMQLCLHVCILHFVLRQVGP
jgi:hypothetical protein